MRKGIIILIAIIGIVPVTLAQTVGHVDLQAVTDSLPSMMRAEKSLSSFQQEQSTIIEDMNIQLERDYTAYLAAKDTIDPILRPYKEKEFAQRQNDIAVKTQRLEQELQSMYQDFLLPIQERLDKAVATVAEAEGIVYVLTAGEGPQSQLLYAGEGGNDLTNKVRQEMIKTEPSAEN
jgi:outer membrane protein